MTVLSNGLLVLGGLLLAHAAYSAHEHSTLYPTSISLPSDIILETLLSVLIAIPGIVLSSRSLQPIHWRVWAGQVEKTVSTAPRGKEGKVVQNPYKYLEARAGFWDIRKQRKQFQEWMMGQGGEE